MPRGAVQHESVRFLAMSMGKVPMDLRRELRPKLRSAAQHLVSDLKAEAGKFSTTIPAQVRMSVSFASRTGGVRVYVSAAKAKGARALENQGRPGTFRHPVYGHRDRWVAQPAHPFFFRTVQKHRDRVRTNVEDAVRASFPKGTP